MYECPIEYFIDNLIFNRDRSCWATFELKGFDYNMLSDEAKIVMLDRLTLFVSNITTEGKFIILPVTQDVEGQIKELSEGLDKKDPLYPHATFQAEQTAEYLKETVELNGASNDYKTFVALKLQKSENFEIIEQARDAFKFLVSVIINDFNSFMNIDTRDISHQRIKNYKKLSEQFFADQNKRLQLIPTDSTTTQWLMRRVMYRGLKKEVKLYYKGATKQWLPDKEIVEIAKRKYIRPSKKAITNLFSGEIQRSGRNLIVEHDTGTSYQTFLTVTSIPDDLSFPDCEWIYLLQQYNKQAEMCINISNIEHREAIKKLDLQRRAANSQVENIDKANAETPDDLLQSKEEIDLLEQELKADKNPLVKVSVVICLSADNEDELEKKALFIRKEYEDLNFVVERPLTDQVALFMQCLPSVTFTVSDFIMKMTPQALSSGIIGATHELGDKTGVYIGSTAGKHIFLDMRQAPLTNRSASTTFYGNLGVGKSFNANLLFYLHIVLMGAYGIIIDPKGERTHWIDSLPALSSLINLVTLSVEPEYKGMLDPFNVFRDNIDSALELALNILSDLFKLKPKDYQYTALLEALDQVRQEKKKGENAKKPSLSLVAEKLNSFDESDDLYKYGQMLSRQIRLLKNSGMAQLLIGDGTESAIELKNRVNILQIQNLKLPENDTPKEDYTQEENISIALMSVMTAFVHKFLHSFPNNFKIALVDESWFLKKVAAGERLMSYAARMSRSLYAALILNGHSVTDLPNEGIKNSITYKFCFKTSNTDEAKRMLEYMNLETTKSNIELIMKLKNAECLFQDLNGRVGKLKFDAVFADLIEVFSTTPVDAAELEKIDAAEPVEIDAAEPVEIDAAEPVDPDTIYSIDKIDIFAYE